MKALVVGAGAIARQHIGSLQRIDNVESIFVCDRSAVTARAMADRYALPGWGSDFEKALEDVRPDVVHVTTPPSSHVGLTRRALEAGCHVVVEKPASAEPHELADLVAQAKARGLMLVEDYNYLFNPSVVRILDDLKQGRYGQLVHVDVSISLDIFGTGSPYLDPTANDSFRRMRGGPVADFLPHIASLTNALIGPHQAVRSMWTRSVPDGPFPVDGFRALVQGEMATASVGFSGIAQPDLFSIFVEGTQRRSRTNVFEGRSTWDRQRSFAKPLVPLANGVLEGVDATSGSLRAFVNKLSGGPGAYSGLWTLLELFYVAAETGGSPPVTSAQMLEVADLVQALTVEAVPT